MTDWEANTISPDVLIVGGGPVGTALACDLLQQGVRVRVIDKAPGTAPDDPHSRAILIVPRTLELLRRIGVSDRLVAAGRRFATISYHSDGRLLARARLDRLADTPYRFMLALPQAQTEAVLRQRLLELGGRVERGLELETLEFVESRPRAVLRRGDGTTDVVTASYVVGADGAASTTRRLVGVNLEGESSDFSYLIADAPIAGSLAPDAHYHYSRDGLLAIVPMNGSTFRIAGNVPHELRVGATTELGTADAASTQQILQQMVDRRAGRGLTIGVPTYARTVRPRCGVADRFQVGRVFLVGDAAHVISPAGGQGMNLGFADAANLGWRLGGVVRGRLDEGVLDAYQRERRGAVARTAEVTARIVGLARQSSRLGEMLRDIGFVLAERSGLVQARLAPLLSQLDVDYRMAHQASILRGGRSAHVGRRLPLLARAPQRPELQQAPASATGSAPELDPVGYTVILWPGCRAAKDWAAWAGRCRSALPTNVTVLDLAVASAEVRHALRAVLGRQSLVATVRPDGHLDRISTRRDPQGAARQLIERPAAPTARGYRQRAFAYALRRQAAKALGASTSIGRSSG